MDMRWPDPPLNVALVHPEIPPNTGNIARLCAATGSTLHLVEPLGFQLTDRRVRRAGLDYWDAVNIIRHESLDAFLEDRKGTRMLLFSTRASTKYTDAEFRPGDTLVFGSETSGLPDDLLAAHPQEQVVAMPIRDAVRSLNLSATAAVAVYEAIRQIDNNG